MICKLNRGINYFIRILKEKAEIHNSRTSLMPSKFVQFGTFKYQILCSLVRESGSSIIVSFKQ